MKHRVNELPVTPLPSAITRLGQFTLRLFGRLHKHCNIHARLKNAEKHGHPDCLHYAGAHFHHLAADRSILPVGLHLNCLANWQGIDVSVFSRVVVRQEDSNTAAV